MKYVRDARVWRDLRLVWPQGRWTSQRRVTSHQARTPPRARRREPRSPPYAITAVALGIAGASALGARPPSAALYRAPTIALVQPPAGGTVPRDKPVAVLRFLAPGETVDPVDARTFAVTVDGVDRTALFQVTADEAWGALAKPGSADSLIALGSHAVLARVCSARGACAEAATTVLVVEPPLRPAVPAQSQPNESQHARA